MAFGKTAGCLILAGAAIVNAAQFPVRHEHWQDHCGGVLTVDEKGVSFQGPKKHHWSWQYQDIEQFTLAPDRISVVTYNHEYRFTGTVPAAELYALLKDRLDQRFVAAIGQDTALPAWSFAVKQGKSEGRLTFGADSVVYATAAKDSSRTWRYGDIDNLSSSGPFELTLVSFERGRLNFADRKNFRFELKEHLPEATYNAIWMQLQKKNAMIQ